MLHKQLTKVFVYGTLKSGQPNHTGFLGTSRKLGDGQIYGALLHLGGFPALVRDADCRVIGEVYEVSWDAMAELDRLEGVPTLYNRQQVLMGQAFGRVWTYYYSNPPVLTDATQVVPYGRWVGRNTGTANFSEVREFFTRAMKTVSGRVIIPESALISLPARERAILNSEIHRPVDIPAQPTQAVRVVSEPVVGPGLEEM